MNTNNIGGVIQADFLFTDEISLFSVINHSAVISLHRPNTWRNLPITYMGVSPDVGADDTQAGTLYKQTLTIRLKRTGLTDSELHILRTINVRGCVVRCKDANGNIRLYGSKEYPLLGTVIEKTGTKPSDLSGLEPIFSGKGAYPPLPVTEL